MRWFFPTKLDPSKWQDFYQNKYQYHAKAFRWIVILMCLAEVSYFVSDCQTFGYIHWKMLLPRTAILVPLIIFCFSINITRATSPISFSDISWCMPACGAPFGRFTIWRIGILQEKDSSLCTLDSWHLALRHRIICPPFSTRLFSWISLFPTSSFIMKVIKWCYPWRFRCI